MNKNIKFYNNDIIVNGIFEGLDKNGSAIINIKGKKQTMGGGVINL